MEDQTQILLPTYVFDKLQHAAELQKTDIVHWLDQVADQYLAEDPLVQIEREQQAYEAQHAQLLGKYRGEYIAMRHGQIVDHDKDRVALGRRVRARYGDAPILITPVFERARQIILVRSPHLNGNEL